MATATLFDIATEAAPIATAEAPAPIATEAATAPAPIDAAEAPADRPRDIVDVIRFCRAHQLPADIVGRWVWVKFSAKPPAEVRGLLKAAGFRWVKSRGEWAHNCGHPSRHGVGAPRFKYGAVPVAEIDID